MVECVVCCGGVCCLLWWSVLTVVVESVVVCCGGVCCCLLWWSLLSVVVECVVCCGGICCVLWWSVLSVVVESVVVCCFRAVSIYINSFYPVGEYTRPQAIAPWGRGRVYSSSTVVCISLLLIRVQAEQATEVILNYDSNKNDYDVASFLVCYVFYCLCCVLCLWCVLFLFMSIASPHVVNIFLTQLHNHSFSVLLTNRKETLHLCRTNISTLLCESFKPLY